MIREYINTDVEQINMIGSLIKSDFVKANNIETINARDYEKIYVYESDVKVIGFIQVEYHIDELDIVNIATRSEFQRHGIAQKLLEYVQKNENINKINLEVRENNTSAIAFYKKNGFIVIGRRNKYYNNEDALVMQNVIKKVK